MAEPKIQVASANTEYAELEAVITVGEESAKLLSERLGREVKPGEQFDIGTIAAYYKDSKKQKRISRILKNKKHLFS